MVKRCETVSVCEAISAINRAQKRQITRFHPYCLHEKGAKVFDARLKDWPAALRDAGLPRRHVL